MHVPENRLSTCQLVQSRVRNLASKISQMQKAISRTQEEYSFFAQVESGRIIELHPGNGGISRAATIENRTSTSRPVLAAVCPLPIDYD